LFFNAHLQIDLEITNYKSGLASCGCLSKESLPTLKFIQKPARASEFIPYQDQEFNDACASLLKNCILAWNYDYLSKIRPDTPDMDEILKLGFIPVWKHVDFSYR